jgi:hypothetical protein
VSKHTGMKEIKVTEALLSFWGEPFMAEAVDAH